MRSQDTTYLHCQLGIDDKQLQCEDKHTDQSAM